MNDPNNPIQILAELTGFDVNDEPLRSWHDYLEEPMTDYLVSLEKLSGASSLSTSRTTASSNRKPAA